jgi:hypothetical protein
VRDITHADVQAWVHTLATDPGVRQRKSSRPDRADRGLSAARVVQAYQVVDQVVRSRFIATNPADDVQLPQKR